jgi:hypothetical protein
MKAFTFAIVCLVAVADAAPTPVLSGQLEPIHAASQELGLILSQTGVAGGATAVNDRPAVAAGDGEHIGH